MENPYTALNSWVRITKPGGFLIITIPDEDLYEQGNFSDKFNLHHKFSFTINKTTSWSKHSVNLIELISSVGDSVSIHKIELLDSGYRYDIPRFDQTRTPVAESAIEVILRKRTKEEINFGGRVSNETKWDPHLFLHLNQYVLDQKAASEKYPSPFGETK
jgi:SAM-dependent methyltransferase